MAISMKLRFSAGSRVRFRQSSVSVPSQYLPKGLVGTVLASYLEPYGVSLREHADLEFYLPNSEDRTRAAERTELRKIPVDQLEPV